MGLTWMSTMPAELSVLQHKSANLSSCLVSVSSHVPHLQQLPGSAAAGQLYSLKHSCLREHDCVVRVFGHVQLT